MDTDKVAKYVTRLIEMGARGTDTEEGQTGWARALQDRSPALVEDTLRRLRTRTSPYPLSLGEFNQEYVKVYREHYAGELSRIAKTACELCKDNSWLVVNDSSAKPCPRCMPTQTERHRDGAYLFNAPPIYEVDGGAQPTIPPKTRNRVQPDLSLVEAWRTIINENDDPSNITPEDLINVTN